MRTESIQDMLYLLLSGVVVVTTVGGAFLILRLSWRPARRQNPIAVRRIIALVGCLMSLASLAVCLEFYIGMPRSVFPPQLLAVGLVLCVIIGVMVVVRLHAAQAVRSWVERLANQAKNVDRHDDAP